MFFIGFRDDFWSFSDQHNILLEVNVMTYFLLHLLRFLTFDLMLDDFPLFSCIVLGFECSFTVLHLLLDLCGLFLMKFLLELRLSILLGL